MSRVLQPDGLLLLAFHAGGEVVHEERLWDQPIDRDLCLFSPSEIGFALESAGLHVKEIVEREPYPEIEYQSRRAYIFAHKSIS